MMGSTIKRKPFVKAAAVSKSPAPKPAPVVAKPDPIPAYINSPNVTAISFDGDQATISFVGGASRTINRADLH